MKKESSSITSTAGLLRRIAKSQLQGDIVKSNATGEPEIDRCIKRYGYIAGLMRLVAAHGDDALSSRRVQNIGSEAFGSGLARLVNDLNRLLPDLDRIDLLSVAEGRYQNYLATEGFEPTGTGAHRGIYIGEVSVVASLRRPRSFANAGGPFILLIKAISRSDS